jgi:succinylarginine dihydrolase
MRTFEVNFDGLVGPTHNYSGLSTGNLASTGHTAQTSNPREAALQGLDKMRRMIDLGLKQGILPPQERPNTGFLRRIGFAGTDRQVLEAARRRAPRFLSAAGSASSMWTANAATVCPSRDSGDGKVHFTPANLASKLHRSLEPEQTGEILRAVFPGERFAVHAALPTSEWLGDEGAANHTRLCASHADAGLHFFVYGRSLTDEKSAPRRFPARQTREASEAIARLHGLDDGSCFFAQQSPEAIDGGVFHNDVIAVGNEHVLLCHERAFLGGKQTIGELRSRFRARCSGDLEVIEVGEAQVSLQQAVESYLFNSQLVSLPDGTMALIAPSECDRIAPVAGYLKQLTASGGPIGRVVTMDLRQSMNNGGGPACLRLRVPLREDELAHCNPNALLNPERHQTLADWVKRHYRDRLSPDDLADPQLLEESRRALDELTRLLGLGSIYPFQK